MSAAETPDGMAAALPTQARSSGKMWEVDVIGRIWRLFTSVRLALILILLLAAAVFVGTMIDQAPASIMADSAAYSAWLDRAEGKYGVFWTKVFDFTSLFNVYYSFWFKLLVALLVANIIVCTMNRWKGIWTTTFKTRIRMGDAFFVHSRYHAAEIAQMPVETAAERVRHAFRGARYRVQAEAGDGVVAVFADKNRFSRFGTFLTHLSLVTLLGGAVIGSLWGFRDDEFVVAEGTSRDVGRGTGLSVFLEHFTDEYSTAGPAKDFRSDLILYENGVEVKRDTIHVNDPMSYKGIRFFQSFFGQTAIMEVKNENGDVLFNDSVPLSWQTRDGNRPVGLFALPENNLSVYVIGPRSGENDPMVPAGEMRVEVYGANNGPMAAPSENLVQGRPEELAGLTFTFVRESRFTGLQVAKDPGVNIVWISAGLMVVGLAMLFYFPPKRIWALCRRQPDGTADVRIATTAERDLGQAKEFETLHERVRLALGITSEDAAGAEGGSNV
ncbi:MAG TPA: cytochrome c biogenesis protein ResB [Dehalococcoidia bacterium]|nr:cytochrome c biogenesis protein ResB [Dehalococcoidia bacterium]